MRRILPFVVVALAACSSGLEHEAPYDPNAPLEKQAKSEVAGVVALSGESDAAGVNVQLQNASRTYEADTGADGSFRITGVVPGTYQLRIGTRYFEEELGTLTVTLGEALDLGTRTLVPRRADVTGSATVKQLVDGATQSSGGSSLTLTKTGSVRSAAAAPSAAAGFKTYAAVVTQAYNTTADGNGDFRFDDVEAGEYELLVETPGASTVTVGNVRVTGEDGDVTVEPVTVEKVSGTFAIDATLADGVTASLVYSGSTSVGLTFTQLGAAAIEVAESADGTAAGCTGWQSIAATAAATRTLGGEGRRYVCARFVDADGNESDTVVRSVIVDTEAPAGTVSVNGGAAYATLAGTGSLTLAATDGLSGVTQVKVAELGASPTCADALAGATVEAYTSTRAQTIAAADGAGLTVCALFGDAAGNWMAAPVSDSIVVDTVAPSAGSVSINGGAVYATSQSATLALAAVGATQMRIANGTSAASAAWEPYRESLSWALPSGDSAKSVTVEFRDDAGNVSAAAADSIILDTQAPTSPSLTVTNANAGGYLNTAVAQLALSAGGAAQMQLSRDGFFDTEPLVTYATAATMYLAGGDGAKQVYARFVDDAGNVSAVVTAGLVVDTALPTGSISINDAAAYATVAGTGALTLAATDALSGVAQVKIAELGASPTCTAALSSATAEAYTSTRAQSISAADGATLTVCALYGDAAGNWMAAPVSDSIIVDTVAPAAPSVSINAAATYATSQTVTLTLSASGASQMRIANGSSTSGGVWEVYRTSVAWSLGSGTGIKEVAVDFRDDAGNVSSVAADTIEVDTDAPASPSLTVTNASAGGFVNTAVAQLGLFAVGASKMQISRDGFFDSEPLLDYATAATAYLAGADGTKAIYARFIDAAGNASAVATANVVLDTGVPTGSISLNDAAAYATVAGAGTLTLTAVDGGSGVNQVKVAELGASPDCATALASASSEAFTSSRAQTIAAADGVTLTVCALFGDAAGNWMAAPVSDSIIVDTVAPSAPAIDIESGATYATSQFVTLTLVATGATEMRIANGSSPASAAWEPYRTSVAWFLPTGVGSKEVSVQFRDAAGNVSLTAADTITLDDEAPSSPALSVTNANAAGYVTTATAQLSLFAVGATEMQISRDGFFDIEPLESYATAATMYLAGGDGVKLLYVRFLDAAGNASAIAAASVVLDTQLPETGFMRIDNNAAWTTDTDVEITFTATGADEVAIGQGACPTTGWQAYATQVAYTLTGLDASAITLYARFRDAAGNTTACISDAIGMDRVLQAPLFAAAVTGDEGVPSKTAKLYWVTLAGITADVAEMQVADDSAFGGAAWRAVSSKFPVPLTKGDGTKTVYVRIRDQAGNTSAASSPSIELDQTGPEAPSLSVTDHSGDGYSVTEDTVELVWSKPTDAYSYSLERFVLGVDGYFSVVASIPDGAPKYTDYVTTTVGRTHLYRMRALDELGNLSSYSVAAEAYPFAPVRRVFKANTSQGMRYFFKPNPGTYSLRPTYGYYDLDNNHIATALVENTIEWTRALPTADIFEESVTLRAANQDGSLVYDTVVPLDMNYRQKLTYSNRGWQQRMAVDVTGVAHVVISNFDGLTYAENSSGSWSYVNWPWAGSERHPSIAVDGSGNPHIAYYADQRPRYKTKSGGVWSEEVIDTATDTGTHTDIEVDRNGVVNVVYFDVTKQDLKFARRNPTWVTQAVDSAGAVGEFARLALDSAGKAHIVYYDQTNQALKYATDKTGPWTTTTLDTGLSAWSQAWYATAGMRGGADIAVGRDDQPRVAYVKGSSIVVQTYDTLLGWQSETVVPVIQAVFAAITIDRGGNPAVAYFDNTTYDLHLARKLNGVWSFRPLHTAADPGRYVSIASDGFGDLHLAYQDDGAVAGYIRLVEPRVPAVIDDGGDAGFGGAAAVGPRDAVYMAAWNRTTKELVFRTNKNGPWETEIVTTATSVPWDSNRVRLALRSTGQVHIVYKDPDVDGLRWWRRTLAGNWSTGFIDTGTSVGDYPVLAVASDDTVWVTYRAFNGVDVDVRYATRTGTNPWSAPQVLESMSFMDYACPIGFKADGTVVIQNGHVSNWWEKAPLAGSFTQNTTDYNTVADGDWVFDANGKIHVASRDPGADKLVYQTNKSGTWTSEVVSQTGLPGTDTRIHLDPEGYVHIVYYDTEYQAVRYATNATGVWVVVTLDAGPKVGRFLSALVDSRNHAQLYYYDEINGALKGLFDFAGWVQPTSVSLSTQF